MPPLASSSQAWFVREVNRANHWLAYKPDADAIAKSLTKGDSFSVYQVTSGIEEVRVVAALCVGHDASGIENPRHLVRIPAKLVDDIRLDVESTKGTTGVGVIDVLHRDLRGDSRSVRDLVERILINIREGGDLLRPIGASALAQQFKAFLPMDLEAANRKRVQDYLNRLEGKKKKKP